MPQHLFPGPRSTCWLNVSSVRASCVPSALSNQSDMKCQGHSLPCLHLPVSSPKMTTWSAAWSGLHSSLNAYALPPPATASSLFPAALRCAKLGSSPRLGLGARTLPAGSLPAALSHPQGLSSDMICSESSSGLLPQLHLSLCHTLVPSEDLPQPSHCVRGWFTVDGLLPG